METRNAIIRNAFLGIEDHGITTAILQCDSGVWSQGFGFHNLNFPAYGIKYIERILNTVGVTSWAELEDKPIRVKATRTQIHAIGHIIEDKWFEPESTQEQTGERK